MWLRTDASIGLRFDSNKFDIVLDKGCLDCLVCTPADAKETQQFIELALSEVARVLAPGGYFVLVSCAVEHKRLDNFFHVTTRFGWKLVAQRALNKTSNFPVVITVYTKA
jgi:SAM-dependent methyltransferase